MPADWSSIAAGYAVVWVPIALFALGLFWRLRVTAGGEDD
jgi:hypothetical protein